MLCLEGSPAHPSDGLPCGRDAIYIAYWHDRPYKAVCNAHKVQRGAKMLRLSPDGVVSDERGEIGRFVEGGHAKT